jgi:hypothetical protein
MAECISSKLDVVDLAHGVMGRLFGGSDAKVEGRGVLKAQLLAHNHAQALAYAPKLYRTKNISIVSFEDKIFVFDRHIKRRRVRHKMAWRYCKMLTEQYFDKFRKRGLI